jgi:MFS family permease
LIILWQFRHPMPESRERRALRLIAISFFALAAYVTFESVRTLLGSGEARPTNLGIGIAVASLIIMPALSWAQRHTGRELGSGSVIADSKQTLLCTYLSGVLLGGLLLNATLGWHWADPIAALVIAAVAVKEGIVAWSGDACCATMPSAELVATDKSTEARCAGDDCCQVDLAESVGRRQERR